MRLRYRLACAETARQLLAAGCSIRIDDDGDVIARVDANVDGLQPTIIGLRGQRYRGSGLCFGCLLYIGLEFHGAVG